MNAWEYLRKPITEEELNREIEHLGGTHEQRDTPRA